MLEDATLLLRVQLCDVTCVTADDGQCSVRVSDTVVHSVHATIAAAAMCDALSRRKAPALDWNATVSRADAIVELKLNNMSDVFKNMSDVFQNISDVVNNMSDMFKNMNDKRSMFDDSQNMPDMQPNVLMKNISE